MNGPLQQRIPILQSDWSDANELPADYETDLESIWDNPSKIVRFRTVAQIFMVDCSCNLDLFASGDDFSWRTIFNNRNQYYQKQLAEQIQHLTTETSQLITETLSFHTNLGQDLFINTSSMTLSYEKFIGSSLTNKSLQPFDSVQIQFPSNLTLFQQSDQSISLRVRCAVILVGIDPSLLLVVGATSRCCQSQSVHIEYESIQHDFTHIIR